MPEVHRYQVVTMLSMAGATIGYDPHGPDVVMASDFDNAIRLFLDAAERCIASERREKELQQRLTAADEQIDELTKPQGEQMACMPVDRNYDVRAKMIIAFNESKKNGGDLDDALDAAYKSALRYSPNPLSAEQPASVAMVLPERCDRKQLINNTHYSEGWNAGLDEVARLTDTVRIPKRLAMTDGLHTYEYVTGHNDAIDKMQGVKS